jgi:SAM-dependent methyltransferase
LTLSPGHESQLLDTRRAFDSVAAEYDGPSGNNALIQLMRQELWRTVEERLAPSARLLDLGCGTGMDAAHFGALGFHVHALDWSPAMIDRTRTRVRDSGVQERVTSEVLGIHQLDRLGEKRFEGIYSNLGPLNCTPYLSDIARATASLLTPGGQLIVSVIGRLCPWEIVFYGLQGRFARARVRGARATVPVPLNGQTVWTRYYSPREFYRALASEFDLTLYRSLSLFLPPPYLVGLYERFRPFWRPARFLDGRLSGLPVLRDMGDHFLMVLTRR